MILDSRLSFDAHVAIVCKTCNYHIWAVWHICRLLPLNVVRTLACSIVSARLDYCNSVLYGAPTLPIQTLQRVQNSLARSATTAENITMLIHCLEDTIGCRTFKESSSKLQLWRIRYALLLCTDCCLTASVNPWQHCGRHLGRFHTYHKLELSTAVAPSVSMHQFYGTVCLLTLLTHIFNCFQNPFKTFLFHHACSAD